MSWAALALVAAAAVGTAPAAGDYDAQLCVSVSTQAANCGPAQVRLFDNGELRARVDDIAYHLSFGDADLVGTTWHGAMQVGEFVSAYRWQGHTLQFGDTPRGLRYQLTVGEKR